jgi:hypothetical protein
MAFPLKPPRDWFDTPEPNEPTPLTFQRDGRVYGHLALWDSCHAGLLNGAYSECVRPPKSTTDYRAFHLGELETEDGSMVSVGKVVYAADHAPLTAGLEGATKHYDNTGAVGAFVRARNGKHGIWLSGAVRSDISEEGFRDLRVNPPSGDWRMLNRNLELIASLSVPVPGYQIPRSQMALAASGAEVAVTALILAGYAYEEEALVASAGYAEQKAAIRQSIAKPRGKGYVRRKKMVARSLAAAALTTKARKNLSRSDFAIPETESYPIQDRSHAANALARSSGKPEEGRVRRAVCKRYPDMGECAK